VDTQSIQGLLLIGFERRKHRARDATPSASCRCRHTMCANTTATASTAAHVPQARHARTHTHAGQTPPRPPGSTSADGPHTPGRRPPTHIRRPRRSDLTAVVPRIQPTTGLRAADNRPSGRRHSRYIDLRVDDTPQLHAPPGRRNASHTQTHKTQTDHACTLCPAPLRGGVGSIAMPVRDPTHGLGNVCLSVTKEGARGASLAEGRCPQRLGPQHDWRMG
jgi:hypothetical protein